MKKDRDALADMIVDLQRDEWLRQMAKLEVREHTITLSTHEGTNTTVFVEEEGSEIYVGEFTP